MSHLVTLEYDDKEKLWVVTHAHDENNILAIEESVTLLEASVTKDKITGILPMALSQSLTQKALMAYSYGYKIEQNSDGVFILGNKGYITNPLENLTSEILTTTPEGDIYISED